jgi:glyoxylase-like metal-dependent hydrolase (beta-lactamase superfamily II)
MISDHPNPQIGNALPGDAPVSRRSLLIGAGAAGVLGVADAKSARSQTTVAYHRFKIGTAEVTVISDGTMMLPVSFALPATPKEDAEALLGSAGLPLDAITNPVNVTIVKIGAETILIDTGAGGEFMPGLGKFTDTLEAVGIKPEMITKVLFTHAHPDHLWGVIDPLDDGTRFLNASHVMSSAEFDYWSAADVESRVAEPFKRMTAGTHRRLKLISERINKRKPGDEIAPGVVLVDTPGHTPGHVSVLITSGTERLFVGGDVLTQSIISFQKPDWPWGPDMDADRAVASRKRTLDMLATDRVPLLGYHMPWPGLGRVERNVGAYRFVSE